MSARLRCAIYTRKSSEEGLEQGFNSLHAQREACEAYVLSQAGEGWNALPTVYDDGGFSGGSMERPGLKKLLADIDAGRIDVVVVYKVDRLTRSLADFAKIVETFDKRQVSFVSVTQAFNTTTSMGRLTLNVLLSFAQFEREVTGERIRDKIAASKAKGLWMGGRPPIGYDPPADPKSRVLVVDEPEAEQVRYMFRRYLELGTVARLVTDLKGRGITTKRWTSRTDREHGGDPWTQGPLYHLLRNRLYLGVITHKGKAYAGQHPAIVDEELFEAVQQKLGDGREVRRRRHSARATDTLAGKLFDDRGHPMSPVSVRRSGRVHRYYVSQALIRPERGTPGSAPRVPAEAVETLIDRELAARVDPQRVDGQPRAALIRAVVSDKAVQLSLDASMLAGAEGEGGESNVTVPAILRTFGGVREVFDGEGKPLAQVGPDRALQKAIARGRRWEQQLATGERSSADEIAGAENVQSRYVDKLLRLSWLAPDLVEAVLAGRRLRDFTLTELLGVDLPADWRMQREMLVLV